MGERLLAWDEAARRSPRFQACSTTTVATLHGARFGVFGVSNVKGAGLFISTRG